jgi:hypothetical protein
LILKKKITRLLEEGQGNYWDKKGYSLPRLHFQRKDDS